MNGSTFLCHPSSTPSLSPFFLSGFPYSSSSFSSIFYSSSGVAAGFLPAAFLT